MFSRFCNLCHKVTNIQFVRSQRCYRKGTNRKRNNVNRVEVPNNIEGKEPIIVCKRKEFNFYKGQTYSKYEPIPLASKGWHHYKSKGDYFFIHPLPDVIKEVQANSFADFGLDPRIVEILERRDIKQPLKIQTLGIPKIMNGANTVIAAETGCGKTFTYLLPLINEILTWKTLAKRPYNSPLGLIVTPSRELAFQIGLEAKKICQYLDIHTKTITGGKTKKMMLDPPISEVDIVVTSFGVISKLTTTKIYKLDMVRHLVLDEADALFHETFQDQLEVFLKRIPIGFIQNIDNADFPKTAQFTLASATMPSRMSEVLENIVNVDSLEHVSSDKLHRILVPQKFVRIGSDDKPTELLKYIKSKIARKEQTIIFCNKTSTCYWIHKFLNNSNIEAVLMVGDMSLYKRQGQYGNFRSGRYKVLCTTNAGSRGLDTTMVRHILNYEFPTATADYIHRCGRTGRVGNIDDCRVTNFISTALEIALTRKIERAVRKMKPIPIYDIQEDMTFEENIEETIDDNQFHENVEQEFSVPY